LINLNENGFFLFRTQSDHNFVPLVAKREVVRDTRQRTEYRYK